MDGRHYRNPPPLPPRDGALYQFIGVQTRGSHRQWILRDLETKEDKTFSRADYVRLTMEDKVRF
jgi:hypothetical protein